VQSGGRLGHNEIYVNDALQAQMNFPLTQIRIGLMPDMKVTVIARFKARDNMIDEAKRELLVLVPLTRAESGCLNYDLHQDPLDPRLFLFYENWTSQADLDKHLNQPHLKALRKKSQRLFDAPVTIEQWQMIS